MENNIVNQVKSFFSEDVLERLSLALGEPKEKLSEGFNASIPAILLGLQSQPSTNLNAILMQAKEHFSNFNFDDWLDKNSGQGSAHIVQDVDDNEAQNKDLLHAIFGNKLATIKELFATNFGLSGNAIQKILSVSLPAIFASLTNHGSSWSSAPVINRLNEQKEGILSALPASLGLAAFGTDFAKLDTSQDPAYVDPVNPNESKTNPILEAAPLVPIHERPVVPIHERPVATERPIAAEHYTEPVQEPTSGGGGIWKVLIALVIIGGLWLLFGKGCSKNETTPVADSTSQVTEVKPVLTDTLKVERESLVVTLPSGKELNAYKNGIEDQLVTFLNSDYNALGEEALKNKWFDFDNLNFELGTAKITPQSNVQLENLVAILQGYPAVKLKIGGYTDKTGDEKLNKQLSKERAEAVEDYFKSKNLGEQIVDAEGYGSEYAKFPASAPESDRILDRHVSVSVR